MVNPYSQKTSKIHFSSAKYLSQLFLIVSLMLAPQFLKASSAKEAAIKSQSSKGRPAGFRSLPNFFVIPDRNTWVYSGAYSYSVSETTASNKTPNSAQPKDSYRTSTQEISPFIAMMRKGWGLGVSYTDGRGTSEYLSSLDTADNQTSELKFRSYSGYVFFDLIPTNKWFSSSLRIGYRDSRYLQESPLAGLPAGAETRCQDALAGFALRLSLTKNIGLLPWVQASTRLNQNRDDLRAVASNADFIYFAGDSENHNYGIDFVITVSKVEIHLGSALNSVLAPEQNHNGYTTKNINLGLSLSVTSS